MARTMRPVQLDRTDPTDRPAAQSCQSAPGLGRVCKACRMRFSLLFVVLAPLALGQSAQARIEVSVTRVGFPTVHAGHVYRIGEWTPVIVDVDLLDQAAFDGEVRVAQPDVDGDQVFDSVEIHLSLETGGTVRRFLYTLANPMRGYDEPFSVELFNSTGESVEVVSQGKPTYRPTPPQQPTPITESELLILSVSVGSIGRVRELVEVVRRDDYFPPLHVAHISPAELPDLPAGLAALDYVVWDDADPADLTDRQRRALLEWVQSGGTLLMASSRASGSIEQSTFAKYLPVSLKATRVQANLPNTRRVLIGPEKQEGDLIVRRQLETDDVAWHDKPYPAPVLVVETELASDGRVLACEPFEDSKGDAKPGGCELITVSERWVGEGRLIFSAVTLKELLSAPDHACDFFEKVFYLRKRGETDTGAPQEFSLFGFVVGAVSFSTSSNVYLLTAIVFSVAYVLIATGGVWWFLGRRRMRHHSWSGFAVVALLATLLSVFSVGWVRGVGERVHQLSVIDAEAGAQFGSGIGVFGLKTPLDQELDLWLPSDASTALEPEHESGWLRPIPAGSDPTDAQLGFADPESYRVVPGSALIEGVRIRSTLKRFEGAWDGALEGFVDGSVVMNRDGTLSDESYAHNNLGVDLENCYLLHAQLNLFDAERGTLAPMPRDSGIYAYPIGNIPAGIRVALAPLCNPQPDPARPGVRPPVPRLEERHKAWSQPLIPSFGVGFGQDEQDFVLGQEQHALLIASTIGEFDPASLLGMGYFPGPRTWSRDRLRRLDLRTRLRRDTAILVGFAKDPGPMRLFRRTGERSYRPLEPDEGHSTTLYRIRIPVRWPGQQAVDDGHGA